MDLQPKHIITTNYDRLIETTENINRMIYEIILKDEDLLKFQSSNYIIKMHGDIHKDDFIVLKEEDYLKYSFKHRLIESMWLNFFRNDYYRNLLIKYGEKHIKYNLSLAIDEGYAAEDEKKVYYKYFDKEF